MLGLIVHGILLAIAFIAGALLRPTIGNMFAPLLAAKALADAKAIIAAAEAQAAALENAKAIVAAAPPPPAPVPAAPAAPAAPPAPASGSTGAAA